VHCDGWVRVGVAKRELARRRGFVNVHAGSTNSASSYLKIAGKTRATKSGLAAGSGKDDADYG